MGWVVSNERTAPRFPLGTSPSVVAAAASGPDSLVRGADVVTKPVTVRNTSLFWPVIQVIVTVASGGRVAGIGIFFIALVLSRALLPVRINSRALADRLFPKTDWLRPSTIISTASE